MDDHQESEQQNNLKFGKKFKHTLDSDEDDDEVDAEKYNVLDNETLEGMERTTIEYDGNIKITPFNMDEELETGHFDKEGTYIFKKENDDVRDNWLDGIDWNGVKPIETTKKDDDKDSSSSDEDDADDDSTKMTNVNMKKYYEQILELMQPGETIRTAIQRYGKQCNAISNNKKGQKRKFDSNKKSKQFEQQSSANSSNMNESKEKMMKLISIADSILQTGDMDIYERTTEQFRLQLNKINEDESRTEQQSTNDDMFSDDFDDNKKSTVATTSSSSANETNKTLWEYRWEDKDDAPIYGPYSSEDMLNWTNQGYFDQGVFVRRTDAAEPRFYSSKRIDFELYI